MGKRWQPTAGQFNNCVERLRLGRFRLFDWAAEEFCAWLAMRCAYYSKVLHGIQDRDNWQSDKRLAATHAYATGMIDCINALASQLPDNFGRSEWADATLQVAYKPDPEGPAPESTDGAAKGTG